MTGDDLRAELESRHQLRTAMERELGPVYRGVPRPEQLRVRVGEDVSRALAWKRGVDDTLAALGLTSATPEGRQSMGIPVELHDHIRDHPVAALLGDPDEDDDVTASLFRGVLAAPPDTNGTRVMALAADEVTELYHLCVRVLSQDGPRPPGLRDAASHVMRTIERHDKPTI